MTASHRPPPGNNRPPPHTIEGEWHRIDPTPGPDAGLSPIAVLVLDGVISAALALGARAAGFGWINAFLLGWAGGAVLTLGLLGAGHALSEALKARARPAAAPFGRRHPGSSAADWDADSAADSAAARRRSRGAA